VLAKEVASTSPIKNSRFVVLKLNQCIHTVLPFLPPAALCPCLEGPEEAKNLAGRMSSA
jgi:hypothetical protein